MMSHNQGFIYDSEAGEWLFTCTACQQTIYGPTRKDLQYQYIKHAIIKPMEARLCAAIY